MKVLFVNDIPLIVVGNKQFLRSNTLGRLTLELPNVSFTGRGIDLTDNVQSHVHAERLMVNLGRQLSDAEISCSLAHKKALLVANTEFVTHRARRWVLIVEDDAEISLTIYERIRDELESLTTTVPTLVSFYSPKANDLQQQFPAKNQKGVPIRERLWIPGAVAYAMNREAIVDLKSYSQLPVDSTPDWPIYFRRVERYVSVSTCVLESGMASTLGVRDRLPILRRLRLHWIQLIHVHELAIVNGVSKYDVVVHLVLAPFVRDFRPHLHHLIKVAMKAVPRGRL
jgi:GR25 family glycosyltransferase involved in LPS biosynthesis